MITNNLNELIDTSWDLEFVQTNDGTLISSDNTKNPSPFFIVFTTSDENQFGGQILGGLDCNVYSASFILSDSVIVLDSPVTTDDVCTPESPITGIVIQTLLTEMPVLVEISETNLILTAASNDVLTFIQN